MNKSHAIEDDLAHEAFQTYAALKQRADCSLKFDDAKAAADAWVVFLNLFLEPDQRMEPGNIIPFPRRRA